MLFDQMKKSAEVVVGGAFEGISSQCAEVSGVGPVPLGRLMGMEKKNALPGPRPEMASSRRTLVSGREMRGLPIWLGRSTPH